MPYAIDWNILQENYERTLAEFDPENPPVIDWMNDPDPLMSMPFDRFVEKSEDRILLRNVVPWHGVISDYWILTPMTEDYLHLRDALSPAERAGYDSLYGRILDRAAFPSPRPEGKLNDLWDDPAPMKTHTIYRVFSPSTCAQLLDLIARHRFDDLVRFAKEGRIGEKRVNDLLNAPDGEPLKTYRTVEDDYRGCLDYCVTNKAAYIDYFPGL